MKKVRCSVCKEYVLKEEARYFGSLVKICSNACQIELQRNQRHAEPKKPAHKKADIPPAVREEVLRRDKNRCRYCGIRSGLHVHHVRYRSEGGSHDPVNLITLCMQHHELVHGDKRRFQSLCLAAVASPLTIPQIERRLKMP